MSGTAHPRARTRLVVIDDGVGLWGAQICILRLAPKLKEAGYELILLAPEGSDMARAWPDATGGPVMTVEGVPFSARSDSGRFSVTAASRTALHLSRRARAIAGAARAVDADLLVANSFWSHFDSAVAGRLTRIPTVLYLHELVNPGLPRRAVRAAVHVADGAIAVSEDVANCIGLPKIRVIPNGVDMQAFSPGAADGQLRATLARDPERPLIVTICRIVPSKQVDHVIRAVAALGAGPDAPSLAVVGDMNTPDPYAAMVKDLGERLLGGRVRFLAARHDIADVLRSANAYVLASRSEGMGIGLIEAQAVGCPVVAYRVPGVRFVVEDGESGALAPAGDWHALAETVARVLSDTALRERLVRGGLSSVRRRFTLEQQATSVITLLDSVRRPPPFPA